jgi:hypothetical protein
MSGGMSKKLHTCTRKTLSQNDDSKAMEKKVNVQLHDRIVLKVKME